MLGCSLQGRDGLKRCHAGRIGAGADDAFDADDYFVMIQDSDFDARKIELVFQALNEQCDQQAAAYAQEVGVFLGLWRLEDDHSLVVVTLTTTKELSQDTS